MRALVLLILVLIVAMVALVAYVRVLHSRLEGIDDPVKWLPRSERRDHARKLLAREQAEYDAKVTERAYALIDSWKLQPLVPFTPER